MFEAFGILMLYISKQSEMRMLIRSSDLFRVSVYFLKRDS